MRALGLILAVRSVQGGEGGVGEDVGAGDDEGVSPPHAKLQSPVLGPGHKILHREMISHKDFLNFLANI